MAESFSPAFTTLIEASCIGCHDAGTDTGLDFETLGGDLSNGDSFRHWEKVFDRTSAGEMPPKSEDRPDPKQLADALASLKRELLRANVAKQERLGRVPARRLTKAELGFTLRDLLLIDGDATSDIPDEVESGSFDTVGSNQRISAVHLESYLRAADQAINAAIKQGSDPHHVTENSFDYLQEWHQKPLNLGGSTTRPLKFGDGFVLFTDVDYLTFFQFRIITPGKHRFTAKIAGYQTDGVVTAKFIVKDQSGGARLVKSIDVGSGDPTTVTFDTYLQPGETPYLTFDDSVSEYGGVFAAGGAKNYRGPGLAVMQQKIEGPLFETWPPPSTQNLLAPSKEAGQTRDQVRRVVAEFAPRALRRPVDDDEVTRFVELATPAIDEGRVFTDAVRVPLRAILTSPQFLMFTGSPGELDDYALANRLSYFLWKSMPDDELIALAGKGMLSDANTLDEQVDRMLTDEKSQRFVKDFLGQWLWLSKVDATTPDDGLYPEYDELLGNAIPQETELFFTELINKNLSLSHLIDSNFTFLNRRLAKHYGIDNIQGQEFRKVMLPQDSPRGGILTQAAVLKTTANGTSTSPVTRGNFVLTNFIGTPPSPPPPGVGSIEPDTRGKTTIREILAAHRDNESCNQCHRVIDPPGFALESFDPIGGFRTNYRASGSDGTLVNSTFKTPPRQGQPVDPSGTTADGKTFSGINEFKQLLMSHKDQVAKQFVSQLIVYSTGGEIEFADRTAIDEIIQRTAKDGYPVRDLIHAVVQSQLFTHK